eukprot:366066_1
MSGCEIIFLQIGQCGNHLGQQFWNTIRNEHKLDAEGMFIGDYRNKYLDKIYFEKINSYFKERGSESIGNMSIPQQFNSKHIYTPRAILIDDDPQIIDEILASSMGKLFNANNFISGSGFASNRWTEHYYLSDTDIIDNTMNIIQTELETCDYFQGFQLCHSIGGGTGGGITSLLLNKLHDFYPNTTNQTFTVHPSFIKSNIESYNAVLSMNQLIENANQTFVIDNDALRNISQTVLNQKEPTYSDLNWIAHLAMNHSTATFRYDINWYPLNRTIRNMGINLVPFEKLHFLLLSYAPLHVATHKKIGHYTDPQELNDAAWSEKNFYANVKYENGKFLCVSHLWRGILDLPYFMDENAKTECKMSGDFMEYMPNSFKYSLHTAPVYGVYPCSLGIIGNTTAMKCVYKRMTKQFNKMFKHKQFVHLFINDGMEDTEFEIANNNLKDLIMEYQDKEDVIYEQGNEYDTDQKEDK